MSLIEFLIIVELDCSLGKEYFFSSGKSSKEVFNFTILFFSENGINLDLTVIILLLNRPAVF